MQKVILKQDIIIPAGTALGVVTCDIDRHGEHLEAVIALGDNHCASFTIPVEDGIGEWFEFELADKPAEQ